MAFSLNLGIFGLKKLTGEAIDGSDALLSLVGVRQVLEKMSSSQKAFENLLEDAEVVGDSHGPAKTEEFRPRILQELAEEEPPRTRKNAVRKAIDETTEEVPLPAEKPQADQKKRMRKIAKSAYLASAAADPTELPEEKHLRGARFTQNSEFEAEYEESHLRRQHLGKKQAKRARELAKNGERLDDFTELNNLKGIFVAETSRARVKRSHRRK